MGGYIYFLTCRNKSTIYIGVTSNLENRVWEHKTKVFPKSFTAKYNLDKLIYYEQYDLIEEAIAREKYLKSKKRCFKEQLNNKSNPEWKDLSEDWYEIS